MIDGLHIKEGFRADLRGEGLVIVELKLAEKRAPVHHKQVLTYFRLLDLPVGLLIDSGAERLQNGPHPNLSGKDYLPATAEASPATARPEHLNTFSAMHLDTRPPAVHRAGQVSLRRGRTGVLPSTAGSPAPFRDISSHAIKDYAPIAVPARQRLPRSPHPARVGSEHLVPTRYPTARRTPRTAARVAGGPKATTNLLTLREPVRYSKTVLKCLPIPVRGGRRAPCVVM